jgi:hypothetical protein
MSQTELLLKEIEGLPDIYMGKILDFVDQIKHNAPPVEETMQKKGFRGKPPLAQTAEKLWDLCKDIPITVDSFLDERHAETEREEAEYRE